MSSISMDREALVQSINFHGQQFHKLCEGNSKLNEVLLKVNPQKINYHEYNARQKFLKYVLY